jgi:hypothetical protein
VSAIKTRNKTCPKTQKIIMTFFLDWLSSSSNSSLFFDFNLFFFLLLWFIICFNFSIIIVIVIFLDLFPDKTA